MAERIRDAISEDATVNAIVVLDFPAQTTPFSMEEQLEAFQPMFRAYTSPAVD